MLCPIAYPDEGTGKKNGWSELWTELWSDLLDAELETAQEGSPVEDSSESNRSASACNEVMDGDDDSVGSDVNLAPIMITRKRKRKGMVIPRILKRDIRRDLSLMYTNVVNSASGEVTLSFLNTFSVPSLRSCEFVIVNAKRLPVIKMNSWKIMVERFLESLTFVPDLSITLEGAQIRQQFGRPGSKVTMMTRVRGNKIHTNSEHNIDLIPKEMDILCMVTLFLDNDHRIYRIETNHLVTPPSTPTLPSPDTLSAPQW